MKSTENNNFISHLLNKQKSEKPADPKADKLKGLSLFEGSSGLFKQLKNKLFSTAPAPQAINAIKDAINNNKAKLANLELGQPLKIAISIPGDGNYDTTHIILTFTKTADEKFNVHNGADIISENKTIKDVLSDIELMSDIPKNNKVKKNSTKDLLSSIKHFKFSDIKRKLLLFRQVATNFINKVSNKTQYRITSYVDYKREVGSDAHTKLIRTLGYCANFGYVFSNLKPIQNKSGQFHPAGKVAFSKENIKDNHDSITLTNLEQIYDMCDKISKSPEAIAQLPEILENVSNKDQILMTLDAILQVKNAGKNAAFSPLTKNEIRDIIISLAKTQNRHKKQVVELLNCTAALKQLGYPISTMKFTLEGKIKLELIEWNKVTAKMLLPNNAAKLNALFQPMLKNNYLFSVDLASTSTAQYALKTAQTEEDHVQLWKDILRVESDVEHKLGDNCVITRKDFFRHSDLKQQFQGEELSKQLVKALSIDPEISQEARNSFTAMLDEDNQWTASGEQFIELMILSMQTYSPEILGIAITDIVTESSSLLNDKESVMQAGTMLQMVNSCFLKSGDSLISSQLSTNGEFKFTQDEYSVSGNLKNGVLSDIKITLSPMELLILQHPDLIRDWNAGHPQYTNNAGDPPIQDRLNGNIKTFHDMAITPIKIKNNIMKQFEEEIALRTTPRAIAVYNEVSIRLNPVKSYLTENFGYIVNSTIQKNLTDNIVREMVGERFDTLGQDEYLDLVYQAEAKIKTDPQRNEKFLSYKLPGQVLTQEELFKTIINVDQITIDKFPELGLDERAPTKGEFRGVTIIETFRNYLIKNPGKSFYDFLISTPPSFTKEEIRKNRSCLTAVQTFINQQEQTMLPELTGEILDKVYDLVLANREH